MNRAEKRRLKRAGVNPDKLSVLWYSNAVWANTGYGTQTAQAVHRLKDDGHAVAVAANYGLEAMTTEYDGIPHYPRGYETYSSDVVEPYFRDWTRQHPDGKPLVLALFDAWPLKGPAWDRLPVAIWTMIDHLPAPPAVVEFLAKPNVTPIAASKFAHEQIERAGVRSLYVPMAIDTKLYKPTPTWSNGQQALTGRELMGFKGAGDEDLFVVSCINANKSASGVHRKAWAENLLAFSIFAANHDDVRLYIHTEKNGSHGGIQMDPLIKAVGLRPEQYRIVNQFSFHMGIPNEAMAALFTATDVLLAPTLGEGFGLTVLEAAACGTPVIVNDFTCQPELVGEGWLTSGQPWWDSYQFAWWNVPNVQSIVDSLEQAYARGRGRSQKQIDHAAQYDADLVYETCWKPALKELANEPSAAIEPVPTRSWSMNEDAWPPRLTIYLPTYQRATLPALLASLAPQLTAAVEVVISDNDPAASAMPAVRAALSGAPCRVRYEARHVNTGGEANLLRGWESGTAPWVWMIGDDDEVLPGAVADVLAAIEHDDVDRLILLTREAPSGAAGMIGTPADLEQAQPGLTIAATLISANVVRRSSLDLAAGRAHVGTMYGWAWAMTGCRRVKVLASPAIKVGADHAGDFLAQAGYHGDIGAVWRDLVDGFGVTPGPDAFSWNFASVARTA